MINEFNSSVTEALGYYVYCLVDPRTKKIFYIGKGTGNRVFNHAKDALNESDSSLKLDTIRDIQKESKLVLYYIIRHGLNEYEAFLIESVLIDLLTYDNFNTKTILSNIQAGHHQWDKGIKTVEEINTLYSCEKICPVPGDKLLCININNTYKSGERENIYEATRKYWKLNGERANKMDFLLSIYKGIVRAVFKPTHWYKSKEVEGRWEFEGQEIKESPYLHKDISNIIKRGQNPITYYQSEKR